MTMKLPPLLVLDRYSLGWKGDVDPEIGPYRPDKDDRSCTVFDLSPGDPETWKKRYGFDAHAVMYSIPDCSCAPRINKAAVRAGKVSPVLNWIIIDVDTPDHVDLDDAPIEFLEQVIEAEMTIPEMAGAIRWASKGGYKYAWSLDKSKRYPVEKGEDYLGLFIDYLVAGGLPVDEQCRDWTRLMRLPNADREGDPNSGNYEVHGLDKIKPLAWDPPREVVAGGRGRKGVRKAKARTKTQEEIQRSRAREAIQFIDPDCDRDQWRDVAIGLKTEFGEAGWSIWQDWSAKGEEYPGDDDVRYQWESFPSEAVDGGVTIRSLWYLAQSGGWSGKLSVEDALERVEECCSLDDYFSTEALRASAVLREENGVGWATAIAQVKQDSRIHPGLIFSNWERKVSNIQKEIEAAKKITAAEIAQENRDHAREAIITNFERHINVEGEEIRFRRPLQEIVDGVRECSEEWPRTMDGVLFEIDEERGEPVFFKNKGELFSWFGLRAQVEWTSRDLFVDNGGTVNPVGETGLFNGLVQAMPDDHRYKTIETAPHVPPVPDAYYVDLDLPEPTGKTLKRYLDLFAPASEIDRSLLEAALLTGMIGIAPGKRPAFVITSDHGRGSGKSSTANALTRVYGGVIGIKADDGFSALEQRLLDPSTTTKRFVMVDNLKNRLSSAEYEAAITEPVISGKRMYVGNGERVNYLTWIFTSNTPALSNDLASRAVVVKIGQADHSVDFEAEINDIIENHRLDLLADIKARLEEPASGQVMQYHDRWQAWQSTVLSRFENADTIAKEIQERRKEVDDDAAVAEVWAAHICELLEDKGHDPDRVKVVIPSKQVLKLVAKVEGDPTITYREMWSLLNDVAGVGPMKRSKRYRTSTHRGLLWIGSEVNHSANFSEFHEPEKRKPAEKVTKLDERRKGKNSIL